MLSTNKPIYMKTLIIINGVTGAIGSACLAELSRNPNIDIYGLSRKALPFKKFLRNGNLPTNTIVCSIGDISDPSLCKSFTEKIDKNAYGRIIYIHAVGIYPFEIDKSGKIEVAHDEDGDGIDDRVLKLSDNAFFGMVNALETTGLPLHGFIFGGIADQYEPVVHKSWWTVMKKVKEKMRLESERNSDLSFTLLNISSVICFNELLTRPFVFQDTDAHPRFWLKPHEVGERVVEIICTPKKGLVEEFLFHESDYCGKNYFLDERFTPRKYRELGIR